jgi:uncharacterized membrane protein
MSEEIFERYLPYAIGLGVEEPWSEAFEGHMAKMLPPGEHRSSYSPRWYSGSSSWNSTTFSTSAGGLVGAVSAGVARASPPSSSGSSGSFSSGGGFSGGGFSGGGGGGGGGGGW